MPYIVVVSVYIHRFGLRLLADAHGARVPPERGCPFRCIHIYIYICIHIYVYRERERDKKRERERHTTSHKDNGREPSAVFRFTLCRFAASSFLVSLHLLCYVSRFPLCRFDQHTVSKIRFRFAGHA